MIIRIKKNNKDNNSNSLILTSYKYTEMKARKFLKDQSFRLEAVNGKKKKGENKTFCDVNVF